MYLCYGGKDWNIYHNIQINISITSNKFTFKQMDAVEFLIPDSCEE